MPLDYISPKKEDAPKIRIMKNARCPLVAPTVPKRVWVTQNILPNLKKMSFIDHDLRKIPEMAMDKYMVFFRDIEDGPTRLVPVEFPRGLDKAGLL